MTVEKQHLPQHIAFIMDGNGRWAAQRGLPRIEGHRAGSKAMQRIVEYAQTLGIGYVTFYAFSTENWKRPKDEVDSLMSLMYQYLNEVERSVSNKVKLNILGNVELLTNEIKAKIAVIESKTKNNTGITVNIAFNYGGRDELVRAAQHLASQCLSGALAPGQITEETLSEALYTAGQPDPDIILRPSGEMRLSNFLLWQAAYSEFIFMDVLWPDFGKQQLDQALVEYRNRDRRFGGR